MKKIGFIHKREKGIAFVTVVVMFLAAFLFAWAIAESMKIQGTFISMNIRRTKAEHLNEAGIIRTSQILYYYNPESGSAPSSDTFIDGSPLPRTTTTTITHEPSNSYRFTLDSTTQS